MTDIIVYKTEIEAINADMYKFAYPLDREHPESLPAVVILCPGCNQYHSHPRSLDGLFVCPECGVSARIAVIPGTVLFVGLTPVTLIEMYYN